MKQISAFKEIKGINNFIRKMLSQDSRIKFLAYRVRWNCLPMLHKVSKFPTHLDIETTNRCNLRCLMCPHAFPTEEFKKSLGSMDVELAKQVIREGKVKGLSSLKLNWRGEPLLWREHLSSIIRYAKEQGIIEAVINTNGLLLDSKLSREIIEAGLDQIIFSVDGDSAQTYEAIRQGGDFRKLIGNIEEFLKIRNSLGRAKPLVRIQMVKVDANLGEVNAFINRWSRRADSITFQDYTNRGENIERLRVDKDSFEKCGRKACPQIWQRSVVTWDGRVVMCCRDWESENVLGKLDYAQGKDLEYFWNSAQLNHIRRLHLESRVEEISACAKCSYKESFRWRRKKKQKK